MTFKRELPRIQILWVCFFLSPLYLLPTGCIADSFVSRKQAISVEVRNRNTREGVPNARIKLTRFDSKSVDKPSDGFRGVDFDALGIATTDLMGTAKVTAKWCVIAGGPLMRQKEGQMSLLNNWGEFCVDDGIKSEKMCVQMIPGSSMEGDRYEIRITQLSSASNE